MDSQQWNRIKEIVAEALDLAPAERPAFVKKACGADTVLLKDVNGLLAFDTADDPISKFTPGDTGAGGRVGPYVIARELGRGGMGVVYLAHRADGQFDQRVAIKLIKRGMDTDAVLRRNLIRTEPEAAQ